MNSLGRFLSLYYEVKEVEAEWRSGICFENDPHVLKDDNTVARSMFLESFRKQ